MKAIKTVNEQIQKLNKNILDKKILLSLYPHVEESTCGGEVIISEIFDTSDIENIFKRFKPYFDNPHISSESQILPIIQGEGNTYICLGYAEENKGFIYYFDFDFGCFLLNKDIDTFLSKLVGN